MDKSLAEGSQMFEADIARLISMGLVTQEEGLLGADSPTNLLWRLQNDMAPVSRVQAVKAESDAPSFTEITLDVLPEAPPVGAAPAPGRAPSTCTGRSTAEIRRWTPGAGPARTTDRPRRPSRRTTPVASR